MVEAPYKTLALLPLPAFLTDWGPRWVARGLLATPHLPFSD